MASVAVSMDGAIIHATYVGEMTMDLVREGERKIEELIARIASPLVLYDTRAMAPPSVTLALEMKSFDSRINDRVERSATVVNDATTAFCAKIAFAFSRHHKVFYHDVDAARGWLRGDAAMSRSA